MFTVNMDIEYWTLSESLNIYVIRNRLGLIQCKRYEYIDNIHMRRAQN